MGLEFNPYLHQRGRIIKNWNQNSSFPLPHGTGLFSGCLGPGSVMVGQPQPLGRCRGYGAWVCVDKTLDLEPTWEYPPATPWLCSAQLGQPHPSSCSSQNAFESAWTLSHLQTISKYFQLCLLNMQNIRRPLLAFSLATSSAAIASVATPSMANLVSHLTSTGAFLPGSQLLFLPPAI